MNVTLQMRYSPAPLREAAAWFIPGDDPCAWLAEMTSWGVPLAEAKLYVVPPHWRLSLRERAPFRGAKGDIAGVVVVLAGNAKPPRTTVAIPYGKLAANLLLPVEAQLDPPLTDAELATLLPTGGEVLIWHPAAGLVRLDANAALSVAQLLAPPPATRHAWDAAQPGVATNQRLLSIEPLSPPSFEAVMQAGRGDIGSQPMSSGGLGKAPGEPAGGAIGRMIAGAGLSAAAGAAGMLASAAQAVTAGLSGLLGGAGGGGGSTGGSGRPARQVPAGSGGPNWMERLAEWARQRSQAMQQDLERLRHNQIERLLHALQNSPDQGLRFALPLTATGAGRGLAPPGMNLTERSVNFNLGGLGGGGPVDFWDISESYRRKLAERYRELANREIALGRHRRAAYILANLLGDLHTAAATLADGGHFREAAVLYEQRLNQPLAAARCLQRGGLLTEAVALFERLGEWETAGDLYAQLDQPEQAERAYLQAVSRLHAAKDVLGAARLLETKLHLPDRAFMTLLGGWDNANQAERCLDEVFALLARGNNHERAEWVIPQTLVLGPRRPVMLAGILARVANNYPHDVVREVARTTTRELVSRSLADAGAADSEGLLRALKMLVPSDRLLDRDCRRFLDNRVEAERRRFAGQHTPKQAAGNRPRLVTSFRLPPGQWKAAVAAGDEFYAAGFHKNWLMVVRGRWDGHVQLPTGDPCIVPTESTDGPIFLAVDPRGLAWTYLHVPPQHPTREVQFAATDKYPRAMRVSPVWGSENPLEGLTYGLGNSLHLLTLPEQGIAQIVPYDQAQRVQGIRTIEYLALDLDDQQEEEIVEVHPLPFFAREQSLYLGIGPWLISNSARTEAKRLLSTVLSITGSAQHTRARIIVGCEQGGYVLWGDSAHCPSTRFSPELHQPVVGLTRGGWLIAATKASVEVFSTHDGRLGFHGQFSDLGHEPLAVLPTSHANRFAIVAMDGLVSVYEVPE
jgi:tetratricopeptide (TPR) repeat protein